MHKDPRELIEQRNRLYHELLHCSEEQKKLLMVEGEEHSSLFAPLSDQWLQITKEIDLVQRDINESNITDTEESSDIINLLEQIRYNVQFIEDYLNKFSLNTSTDLRNVKNQQRVMNAYYHLQSKDQVALYLDEKK